MPTYDYKCPQCEEIVEIMHSMSCEDEFLCSECQVAMEKQLSCTFYVANSMGPTIADRKEEEHQKKVKDPDRARRKRIKEFGSDAVGVPTDKPDPKHIVKRGKTVGGKQMEVDKKEFTKALAKDPMAVKIAQNVVKNKKK